MDTGELQGQHVVLGNVLSEIKTKVMYRLIEDEALCKRRYDSLRAFRTAHQQQDVFDLYRRESCVYILRQKKDSRRKAS